MRSILRTTTALLALSLSAGCLPAEPLGLADAPPAKTTVAFDWYHRPLPNIPLPNDLATRYDATSATGLRINASQLAPTHLERHLRHLVDQLDGWGVMQPITIPFTGPLDIQSIVDGHRDADYDLSNDVVYLINVDRDSPELGRVHHLDVGNGNYPVVLEKLDYWHNDPRDWTLSLMFEEADEDLNGNGVLDLGGDANGDGVIDDDEWPEDTDADGVLDVPNYLPGASPARDDLAGRADALMYFYERQTNTLILRPMMPLRERTTYAVVVTRRLKDEAGEPVGSPFPAINHESQTHALDALPEVLPEGLKLSDVAFAFSFTTQSIEAHWKAVRDGLYGHGVQAAMGEQHPAEFAGLEILRDPDSDTFAGVKNPYVLPTEQLLPIMAALGGELLGMDPSSFTYRTMEDAMRFIDYQAIARFSSPQLFPRFDDGGQRLPENDQSWPPDLDRVAAPVFGEDVYVTFYIPRKEASPRGQGQHAPVMIMGHGYTSNRIEALSQAGFMAKHGLATVAIDCPSHGIGLDAEEAELARSLLGSLGLGTFLDAVLKDRAVDLNRNGGKDSGADFWTSYLFHTRDVVRQCTVDYMQLVRILRTFDGKRRWAFDVNGDGEPDLAGDFDGDGKVDIGAESIIAMSGGSLGGIMSQMVGALEPEVSAIVPISGGGGLIDVGNRSLQGGVREAVQLRLMAPIYTGTLAEDGTLTLRTVIPDLNKTATRTIATVADVRKGDTVLAENLINGERGCGFVDRNGNVRVAVASDLGDATRLSVFRGPVLAGKPDCELQQDAMPFALVERFGHLVQFQGRSYGVGEPLVSLAEGMALHRATPEFRRLLSLAQFVVDPADPGVVAPHLLDEPLTYEATGTTTGAHTLVVTTMGDMNVPASSGLTHSRTAGLVGFLEDDPRYGKPANQVLIDTYAAEAVHVLGRYTDANGTPVHIDLEDFSEGDDYWTPVGIPRLDPPLRLYGEDKLCERGEAHCGISGSIWPFPRPDGQHGFDPPGSFVDRAIARCQDACKGPDAPIPCGQCKDERVFDIGMFMFNMLGKYGATGGKVLDTSLCHAFDDCPDRPETPPTRDDADLP